MTVILDSNGTALKVGMRVLDEHGGEEGTITGLSDPDGDINEYGRPIPIGPYVVVRYDNGDVERWTATRNATGPWDDYRTDYTCDDITVTPEAALLLRDLREATRRVEDAQISVKDHATFDHDSGHHWRVLDEEWVALHDALDALVRVAALDEERA